MNTPFSWCFLAILLGLIVLLCVWMSTPQRANEKWGTQQIGLGYYPPWIDPTANGPGGHKFYNLDSKTSVENASSSLSKFYNFVNGLTPQMRSQFYELFPSLETQEAVQSYGLSDYFMRTVKLLDPYLTNPQDIKTPQDFKKKFAPLAITFGWNMISEKPEDGLFKNWRDYGWGINVF